MTTHYMALTNIPLTKAFLLQYENAQSSDKPRQAKPRVVQHSIAKRIIVDKRINEDKRIIESSTAKRIIEPSIHILPSINILPSIHILPEFINIQIKTVTGKAIFVKINPAETILQLKKQIYLMEDISLESQRIIFGGKQLEDNHTLCHYNITNDSIVSIIIRLRGGMFHKSSSRADFISLNYSNKMERGLSMLDYMKHESSREMFFVLDEFEEMLKNTRDDTEINMVYDLIRKIYSE